MDDEGKWDKEQQHLDDHNHDLWLEEAMLTCEHEDFKITNIENVRTHGLRGEVLDKPTLDVELTCEFCGKNNFGAVYLHEVLEMLAHKLIPDTYEEWW